MTLSFFSYGVYCSIRDEVGAGDLWVMSIGAGVIALGTVLIWWLKRRRLNAETIVSVVLNIAYLGNATMCMVEFHDNRDPGWWWTFYAAVPMSLEACWTTFRSFRRRHIAG
jgi:hypothetical protein